MSADHRPRPIPTDPDAFIAWENRRKQRWELVAGEVRMMSGGTLAHDLIASNLLRILGNALGGGPCFVHGSNLKIRSPTGTVTYPDAFVRCGPITSDDVTEIEDPVLVVEVLSPRTRSQDLIVKRWAYQAIPSLQLLLYVEPKKPKVELVAREPDGSWRSRFFERLDNDVPLEALGIALPLRQAYAGTNAAGGER